MTFLFKVYSYSNYGYQMGFDIVKSTTFIWCQ